MDALLCTEHIRKYYGRRHVVKAVDDVSLNIEKGRSLALIGESGSGKTTFGKVACCLERATDGNIRFMGRQLESLREKDIRPIRRDIQMIFQSSGGVFDPTYTVGDSIREILRNYERVPGAEVEERIDEVLRQAGLEPSLKNRYAAQLSGGQCQRANIARALILRPKLVICDEPVSSLDYSIRKQILNLLNDIQERFDVTYLLITHDLSNVPYLCRSVAIMFQGRIVEQIDRTDDLRARAVHPYTRQLFASIPIADPEMRTIGRTPAEKPVTARPVERGCAYQHRCPQCAAACRESVPELRQITLGHQIACHNL